MNKQGRGKEAVKYLEENKQAFLRRISVDRALNVISDLRKQQEILRRLTTLHPSEKASLIQNIDVRINRIAAPFSNVRNR